MITRILHVSDLHFGARDDPILERGLTSLIERVGPELVIASGDLTNRGPGNHDIPYTFPDRFTSTWREFERQWATTEPEFAGTGTHVIGLNSVRPWRHQSGGVSDAQLQRATAKLHAAAPEKLRVVWKNNPLPSHPSARLY